MSKQVNKRNILIKSNNSLAYAEMRLILARFLWNFNLELADDSTQWVENMKMFNLWEKPPLFVKLTPVV